MLQSIISADFTPWGATTYTPGADQPFTCPNGPNECLANRIHVSVSKILFRIWTYCESFCWKACAINRHINEPKGPLHLAQFIICYFDHSSWAANPADAGNQCANKVWFFDPWPQIEFCATQNTDDEINIYLEFRDKTQQISPTYCMQLF